MVFAPQEVRGLRHAISPDTARKIFKCQGIFQFLNER